ncbi:MAG: fumarate lyase [Rhodospirillales bacterium 20-58-10]|nr:MAG: fumarate lyase [Rhodospirillales bacterium 20-58-10]
MPQPPANSEKRATRAEVRALFSRSAIWQSWLDVEATLAQSQAELGMIPEAAAHEIMAKASLTCLDEAEIAADIAKTRAPIVSIVRILSDACDGDAGGYVHWGATTQNVVQTGRSIIMRRSHHAFMRRFNDVLLKLADLAEISAEMPIAGRTNGRHALPITFGFKVAGWIEEWLRHLDRFTSAEPRVFSALWGGAVGAMHAFGDDGPELNRRLSQRLGLYPLAIPSRAGMDYFAEYIMLLALFSATCAKIARDLYMLMTDETSEVYEALGDEVIGSSTMPHKVNSKIAVHVISLAAQVRAQMPLALEAMQPSFEGDGAHNQMISALIDQSCPLAYEMLDTFHELIDNLRLDPARMRHNLDLSGEFIASERAMMVLAPLIGRTHAHDLVHEAVAAALQTGVKLSDMLMQDPAVQAAVSRDVITAALDATTYTGLSVAMTRDMVATARQRCPA